LGINLKWQRKKRRRRRNKSSLTPPPLLGLSEVRASIQKWWGVVFIFFKKMLYKSLNFNIIKRYYGLSY